MCNFILEDHLRLNGRNNKMTWFKKVIRNRRTHMVIYGHNTMVRPVFSSPKIYWNNCSDAWKPI